MIIETARCRAAPVDESDRDDIERLYANEKVREFLGGTVDKETFATRFSGLIASPEEHHWAVRLKEDRSFAGIVSLDAHHDGHDKEISYQFMPEVWGRGVATEAVGAIIDYSLQNLDLPRVISETQVANDRSRLLLERLSMTPLKTLVRFGAEQIIYEKSRS